MLDLMVDVIVHMQLHNESYCSYHILYDLYFVVSFRDYNIYHTSPTYFRHCNDNLEYFYIYHLHNMIYFPML